VTPQIKVDHYVEFLGEERFVEAAADAMNTLISCPEVTPVDGLFVGSVGRSTRTNFGICSSGSSKRILKSKKQTRICYQNTKSSGTTRCKSKKVQKRVLLRKKFTVRDFVCFTPGVKPQIKVDHYVESLGEEQPPTLSMLPHEHHPPWRRQGMVFL
ncbi:hypothetical protein MMC07_003626, partial [Pseudocyphellaria aurata]|nr:hypothetical protein [Pseudocyphellaria aurata]